MHMMSYTANDNYIGSAVSEILRYTDTDTYTSCYLYKDLFEASKVNFKFTIANKSLPIIFVNLKKYFLVCAP